MVRHIDHPPPRACDGAPSIEATATEFKVTVRRASNPRTPSHRLQRLFVCTRAAAELSATTRRRWIFVARDPERHGWRDGAYTDVFTACPAQRICTGAGCGHRSTALRDESAEFTALSTRSRGATSRRRCIFVAMDPERHGWRDGAYTDVFTACPAQRICTGAGCGHRSTALRDESAEFTALSTRSRGATSRRRCIFVAMDPERHGWRDGAYT